MDYIFGLRAIIEAIRSNVTINKVYLQKGLRGSLYFELESLIKDHKISISIVPVEKLVEKVNVVDKFVENVVIEKPELGGGVELIASLTLVPTHEIITNIDEAFTECVENLKKNFNYPSSQVACYVRPSEKSWQCFRRSR